MSSYLRLWISCLVDQAGNMIMKYQKTIAYMINRIFDSKAWIIILKPHWMGSTQAAQINISLFSGTPKLYQWVINLGY